MIVTNKEGKHEPEQVSVPFLVRTFLEEGITGTGCVGKECFKTWGLGKFVGTKHWLTLKASPNDHGLVTLRFKFTNGVNTKDGFTVEKGANTFEGVPAEQLAALVEYLLLQPEGVEIVG